MAEIFIKIESLKKYYAVGKKEALKGISFDIYQGEIIALLGVNGAGKTTLSSIVAGIHPPTSGTIIHQGKSIYEDLVGYKRLIGFCPQKPNFDMALSVEENLFFAGLYYGMSHDHLKDRIKFLMNQFELHEYAASSASVLSGGYKQRFLIARTLIHHPKLIILDEPTVGLDPHMRHQLWNLIVQLKQNGSSILLTTHYIDEAERLSDRVCIIDSGIIKVIDTPDNLKNMHQEGRLEDVFLKLTSEREEAQGALS